MKILYFLVSLFLMSSCNFSQTRRQGMKPGKADIERIDSLAIVFQLDSIARNYKLIEQSLYDSVRRITADNIDFSRITAGIQRKREDCHDEMLHAILGVELARNYFLCYRNNKKITANFNASEKLFYEFLQYKNGLVAGFYLNINRAEIQNLTSNWNNFSRKDREEILFYALLRGFENGLPEIMKAN